MFYISIVKSFHRLTGYKFKYSMMGVYRVCRLPVGVKRSFYARVLHSGHSESPLTVLTGVCNWCLLFLIICQKKRAHQLVKFSGMNSWHRQVELSVPLGTCEIKFKQLLFIRSLERFLADCWHHVWNCSISGVIKPHPI